MVAFLFAWESWDAWYAGRCPPQHERINLQIKKKIKAKTQINKESNKSEHLDDTNKAKKIKKMKNQPWLPRPPPTSEPLSSVCKNWERD